MHSFVLNLREPLHLMMKMKTTLTVLLIMELYGLSSGLKQHFFVSEKKSWSSAQDHSLEYCRKQYNDLASLSSLYIMDSALGQSTQAETEYVWTGLRFLAGEWFWVNGHDLDYTAWYQKVLPQCPARDLHCGALDMKTMLWTHRNCEEKFHFLCQ
uniref:C-type lectin domain-containing protein n=1 Tax=Cyprinus carpio TaxID=7962 RepID=A0A8C1N699_CYPCA